MPLYDVRLDASVLIGPSGAQPAAATAHYVRSMVRCAFFCEKCLEVGAFFYMWGSTPRPAGDRDGPQTPAIVWN